MNSLKINETIKIIPVAFNTYTATVSSGTTIFKPALLRPAKMKTRSQLRFP